MDDEPTMTRLAIEREYHDAQAAQRRAALKPEDLIVDDDVYLDHETWIRPAMDRLGDVRGMRVLDLGCGHGMAAIVLARRGARVTGLELSGGYLDEARARADSNGVAVDWVQADAQSSPFPDASFDRIWGNAILHHLDLAAVADEIHRVLRPGGKAVFCEPWGDNPLLRMVRRRLSYPEKHHTVDEEPLRSASLAPLQRRFPGMAIQGQQLLSMVRRFVRGSRLVRNAGGARVLHALERVDRACLSALPGLQRWCRYMILELPRES